MNQKTFFSIIIPTLNEEKYLPKLLKDLSVQTFSNFEVIVVDGNSIDNTVKIAKSFSQKLNISIITSPKRHVCTQRNLGAKHAKSKLLVFSDADNRLPKYFLQGLKYRWEASKADIITPYIEPDIKNAQNNAIAKAFNLFLEAQKSIKTKALLEALVLFNSKSFHKIGGFNDKIDYAEGIDIMRKAEKLNLTRQVIKDPSYSFSFRRFRKYGILNAIGRIANVSLSTLIEGHSNEKAKRLYPMLGGTLFDESETNKNKVKDKIMQLLKKIQEL